MTITTKENAAGRISTYYVDGVKTRKCEIEGAIYDAARKDEIIYVDYYTGQEFKSLVRSCYRNMKVVFTNGTHGAHLMTETAAEDLGWRVIKKYRGTYCGLNVCEVEEMTVEADIDDYAVTVEAQDAAIDAEIENAKSNLRKIVDVQDTPTDNFTAQLAELQAKVDAARAVYDAKTNERMRLQAAVEDAKIEESISYENLRVATSELDRFGDANAKELRNNLITSDIRATRELIIYSQAGSVYCPALKYLDILFINGKFEIRCDKEASCIVYKFATYYTPEQVTAAISQLKDAIAHGKQTFQFPSVEELNQPLSLPTNIKDSLQRAMQTALDKYKDFCRTGQLVRAEHELKLYNICRRAKIQLACGNDQPPPEVKLPAPFKPTDADSAPSKILPTEFCLKYLNDAAPDGWTVTADGKAFLVKFKGNVIATLDSLATAKALPPDKFFDQFTPLAKKDFEPKEIFIKDLYRELNELLDMRDELPDDSDRLPTIDAMIDQLKRDIAKAEFDEWERTGIPIWF